MIDDIKASASCWFSDIKKVACLQGNLQDAEVL